MQIAIIGAGNIGSTLGKKWATAGYTVAFGVRDPGDPKYQALKDTGVVLDVSDAVAFGEVVLLALPGGVVTEFAAAHGPALTGKLVIDATNNLRGAEMHSLGVLAAKAPEAQLGRAFNTLGWENFADPQIGGVQIDLFFCAQPAARTTLETLISQVGLRPIYVGNLDTAPALDGMTRLWFALGMGQGRGRRTAFKLLSEA